MTLKDSYEKWELIFTPFVLIFALIALILISRSILDLVDFENYFLYPLFAGLLIGVGIFLLLDYYWLKVVKETIGKFLRLPTYLLILLAMFGIILINMGFLSVSLIILMMGLGIMFILIIITSIMAFYRSYYMLHRPASLKQDLDLSDPSTKKN